MKLLAIDPGPKESAWVVYEDGRILDFGKEPNDVVRIRCLSGQDYHLAIEMVQSFGLAVGAEVFETVFWIGRMVEAWGRSYTLIYRKDVKMHLCNSMRAKDANIRQALIDRFGPGKDVAIGNKRCKGPLHGISKDVWSALAVAVTYSDQVEGK